jgi:phosphoserine phosphatase
VAAAAGRRAIRVTAPARGRRAHRTILTSGTYAPITQAFARRAGISDAIGTPLQFSAGTATSRIDGALNDKDVKAARLREYLGAEVLDTACGDTAALINGWRILE